MKDILKQLYQKLTGTETSKMGNRIAAALPDGTRIEYHRYPSSGDELFIAELFIAVFPEHTIIPPYHNDPPNYCFVRFERQLPPNGCIKTEIHFPTQLPEQSTTPQTFAKIWETLQAALKETYAVEETIPNSTPPGQH